MKLLLRSLIVCAASVGLLAHTPTAHAQAIAPESDISRLRVPVPLPRLPEFDLRIQAPEKAATPRAVDEIIFEIKGIRFDGGSQYSESEMSAIFADIIGTRATLDALRKRVSLLEDRYKADGFFLTRVLVPPQEVRDGRFTVQIIEGFISSSFIEGGTPEERAFIESEIATLKNRKPIDLASLETVLLRFNDMPSVAASGTLRPGGTLGASELVVSLSAPPPVSFQFSINNLASKTLGPGAVSLNTSFARPFGSPGLLGIGLASALDPLEKLRALTLQYAMPIGARGSTFSIGALTAKARPKGSLQPLNIVTESMSISPRFRMPIVRTRAHSVFLDAGLSVNETETTLDGNPTTEDRSSVSEISLTYQQNGFLTGSTQIALGLFKGLSILGAYDVTDYNPDPNVGPQPSRQAFDQRFFKQVLSFQRLQSLSSNFSLLLTAQIQNTSDSLLAGEQVSFGGSGIGRGYDSGAITGDRGKGGLIEIRWDQPKAVSFAELSGLRLQWFASYDSAQTKSKSLAARDSIDSFALGLRARDSQGLSVEMMVADAQTSQGRNPDQRHDPRFLISISKSF